MMMEHKEDILIRYFEGKLNAEELVLFEKMRNEDPEFQAQFELENRLQKVIQSVEHDQLKNDLQALEAEIEAEEPAPTQQLKNKQLKLMDWKKWVLAASILLAVSVVSYQYFVANDLDKLYQQHYDIYPNISYVISRGDNDASLEKTAFTQYESGEFEKAVATFDQIENPEPYIGFYKGQAYLAQENWGEAQKVFEKIIAENLAFSEEAHWYLALTQLKMDNVQGAKKNLEWLLKNSSYKKAEVEELAKEL